MFRPTHMPAQESNEPATAFDADKELALACARADASALARFEQQCLPLARQAIARIDAAPSFVDEVMQSLRERLLCPSPTGGPPRIGSYQGRGSLSSWVRAAALRLALNHKRQQQRLRESAVSSDEALGQLAAQSADPELDYIRAHYRDHFREAFQSALAALPSRSRTVLRLQLLDGLTAEQIGLLYSAHRVSVARWLGQVRTQLLSETRRLLAQRLGFREDELESLTGLVPSRLDLSLSRLLRRE